MSDYVTRGGIAVTREVEEISPAGAVEGVIDALDRGRGGILASCYEVPGRYTRWDLAFVDPPLVIQSRGRALRVAALCERGAVLLPAVARALREIPAVARLEADEEEIRLSLHAPAGIFPEEERSRQPSVFSALRGLLSLFASDADPHLGLYGAFGYDLAFQFEPIPLRLERAPDQRDLVLYLPDEIIVVDHRRETAARRRYDFEIDGVSTAGLPRAARAAPPPPPPPPRLCDTADHLPGEYAATVRRAKQAFRSGDLYEVVPSQTFYRPAPPPPSRLFRRLRERNPSPYAFLLNLGEGEFLVGASPEMYVRVTGRRVETCPIAGTIPRGRDALGDAEQIRRLLGSAKDECELTMCTDVDRNDKSRICEPGSVRVLARRQIEIYSRLIHTVDHVEGRLLREFDALDAFLAHTWAVTVTGAPKRAAMEFIEEVERSPRRWYGGAVGLLGFDGDVNTGITLRTVRIARGVAEVRVGATLLHESDPEAEEAETRLKAAAFLDAIRRPDPTAGEVRSAPVPSGRGKRILLVDAQDSFVHLLGDYFRQTGAKVKTLRAGFPSVEFDRLEPDLVVLSAGPGRPSDFGLGAVLAAARARGLPVFGVCLGLQAMAEYFGGELGTLGEPVHGKPSRIRSLGGTLFRGFPREFVAGRYHSLFAIRDRLPGELRITAESDDGVVMALEHRELPFAAVQFHPESILSLEGRLGHRLIENVVLDLEPRERQRVSRITTAGRDADAALK